MSGLLPLPVKREAHRSPHHVVLIRISDATSIKTRVVLKVRDYLYRFCKLGCKIDGLIG